MGNCRLKSLNRVPIWEPKKLIFVVHVVQGMSHLKGKMTFKKKDNLNEGGCHLKWHLAMKDDIEMGRRPSPGKMTFKREDEDDLLKGRWRRPFKGEDKDDL